jgi:hypothetical protein
MSLRAAVIALVGGCALLTHPLHAQSGMQAAEQLLIPFSAEELREWKVGAQAKRPNLTMVEYIPKGQLIDKWDRMLTVQIFHRIPVKLADFMGKMKSNFEAKQPCDQTQLKAIESKKVNGYEASLHQLTCTRSKQNGKGEFTFMLGIQGRDALYIVQRAWRGQPYAADAVPLSKAEFKAWLTFLGKVQVCDPRVAGHPCPKGLQRPDKRT